MVERADRAAVGTFYAPGAWSTHVELGEPVAHHAAVKRLATGDVVRLTNGDGTRAFGTIHELTRRRLIVSVDTETTEHTARPPHIELWAPVGDRERMLFLAEKATELGASSWRPVVYRRSRSVRPRGDGESFREKVRLRMISALEQSGGAWLPATHAELPLDDALRTAGTMSTVLLEATGTPLVSLLAGLRAPIAIALGPEGGLDPDELDAFRAAGWRSASLGGNVLRFETAGLAALAIVRAFMLEP
ncbi:MAG TPA: RsmE family RNA methyltransferase [Gemmatimonadaceae bacterium]